MMTGWPLVGREHALERVSQLIDRDDVRGAVLVGPAGVGKTRLATACIDLGEAAGMSTAVAVASRAASEIPLGALSGLLPPVPVDAPPGLALLQFARQGLADLADGRRLMLVVDDAHNLDDASALVVHQLTSSGDAFVIATVRSGEVVPDPVVSLWKDGVAERVEVGALPPEAAAQLVEIALGGPVEAVAAQALTDASEGNVLYLRELILAGLETHALVDDAGLWRLVGSIASSPRLADLVSTRLAGLSEEEVSALELVAFGEPIGVDVIERLSTGAALDQLERKGLLVTQVDQRRLQARLAHPIHGDVLRDRTPVLRARAVQRALADATEQSGARRRDDALRVAIWRLDGGGDVQVDLMVEGARLAKFAYDYDTAERLARYAFEVAPTFEAGEMLAGCVGERGDAEGTELVLAELEPLATTDEERARLAGIRASLLFWVLGRGEQAIAVCEQAMAAMTDEEAIDDVAGQVAVLETSAGRPRDSLERIEHLLDRGEGRVFCHAALAGALSLSLMGRQAEAVDLAERGVVAYEAIGTQFTMFEPSLLNVAKANALIEAGRLDEARALGESGFARAVAERDDGGWAFFSMALGTVDLEVGTFAAPTRRWREAAARFMNIGRFGHARWALSGLALSYGFLGDATAARAVLDEIEALGDHPARREDTSILRAKGWLAVAEHDLVAGLAAFSEGVELAAKHGMAVKELAILHDMARLGRASSVLDRAQELLPHMDGPLASARVRHIAALARGKAADLGLAGEELEACGCLLTAAEAMYSAADSYRSSGDSRHAGAWSRRAAALAAQCEGARTPGLTRVEGPTPLTKREREIALMAGDGLSSREISEQLFLSIRTVDNHLSRVYEKLGISSRAELTDALSVGE